MRRKWLVLAGLATGALAGTVLYRRGAGARRERLDVYFDDGSMVSFSEGSGEAEQLLPVARSLIATARP
jgi:hypothetical protein